jgi:phospholipid/cholesterol/gamma-HCH transport system substrate-binding protein
LKNVESITGNLNANNDKVSKMLSNFNDVSTKANTVDFSKINAATDGVGQSVEELKKTLTATQNSLNELTTTIKKINSGSGTIGQFATNDSVYHSLNLTLLHTQALMQDLRLNPKRYINLNPFKKYKTYQVPSQDPLLDTLQKRFNTLQRKN